MQDFITDIFEVFVHGSSINTKKCIRAKNEILRDIETFNLYDVYNIGFVDDAHHSSIKKKEVRDDLKQQIIRFFNTEKFNNFRIIITKFVMNANKSSYRYDLEIIKGKRIEGKINLYELYYCVHYDKYHDEEIQIFNQCQNVMAGKTNVIKAKKKLRPLIMKTLYLMKHPQFRVDKSWFKSEYTIVKVQD